jgi:hypothetical protein
MAGRPEDTDGTRTCGRVVSCPDDSRVSEILSYPEMFLVTAQLRDFGCRTVSTGGAAVI